MNDSTAALDKRSRPEIPLNIPHSTDLTHWYRASFLSLQFSPDFLALVVAGEGKMVSLARSPQLSWIDWTQANQQIVHNDSSEWTVREAKYLNKVVEHDRRAVDRVI